MVALGDSRLGFAVIHDCTLWSALTDRRFGQSYDVRLTPKMK
jgi:hypothetical protein